MGPPKGHYIRPLPTARSHCTADLIQSPCARGVSNAADQKMIGGGLVCRDCDPCSTQAGDLNMGKLRICRDGAIGGPD